MMKKVSSCTRSEPRFAPDLVAPASHSVVGSRRITTDCPSYYLYPAELALLKEHSASIVAHLFPPRDPAASRDDDREPTPDQQDRPPPHLRRPPVERWRVAAWGDDVVGRHNGGVNSEQGLGGRDGRGRKQESFVREGGGDCEGIVLELGAGSLSKTRCVMSLLQLCAHVPFAHTPDQPSPESSCFAPFRCLGRLAHPVSRARPGRERAQPHSERRRSLARVGPRARRRQDGWGLGDLRRRHRLGQGRRPSRFAIRIDAGWGEGQLAGVVRERGRVGCVDGVASPRAAHQPPSLSSRVTGPRG